MAQGRDLLGTPPQFGRRPVSHVLLRTTPDVIRRSIASNQRFCWQEAIRVVELGGLQIRTFERMCGRSDFGSTDVGGFVG